MKKIIKTILLILNLILSLIFIYNCLIFNISSWNVIFISAIVVSIITQIICLNNFKFWKRLLFVLLNIGLTFISSFIGFLVTGFLKPFSPDLNLSIFATLIGLIFIFINFTIFYTYLMSFINKLKEKEKPKSSFVKLLIFYSLLVIILETLIMILSNKP